MVEYQHLWNDCLTVIEITDKGMRRATNQDSSVVVMQDDDAGFSTRGHLFVVCDGMGAHAAGELASSDAVTHIPHHYLVFQDLTPPLALRRAIEGVFEISMTLINLVIRLAPYAVACFMFNLAALFGFELIIRLGAYVGVVVLALGLHMIVTYGTAVWLSGRSPLSFFRDTQEATVMAFSTASSNAALPTALRVADQMGLPQRVSRFVLTVGATANQNGTALFEGVTVIFLAQFFGVDLSIGQQFMVMAVCILGGIGTAGVPSGSLPVVAMICAMVALHTLASASDKRAWPALI